MSLLAELTRLNEEREGGALHESKLREKLQQLVIGDQPADASAMETELKKLRYEAALMQLDREYEAIHQDCLIRYRGSFSEPTLGTFWGLVIFGTVFTLVFLRLAAQAKSEMEGPLWLFVLAAIVCFAVWMGREAVQHYHKWSRLADASHDRLCAREMLEQSRAVLVETRTPGALIAAN